MSAAQTALSNDQTALTNARNTLNNLDSSRASQQRTLAAAQDALSAAQNRLSALQNASQIIDQVPDQTQTPTQAAPSTSDQSKQNNSKTTVEEATPFKRNARVKKAKRTYAVYNAKGTKIGSVKANRKLKIRAKRQISGKTYYEIAKNKWIAANSVKLAKKGKTSSERRYRAVAYAPIINHKRHIRIALRDSRGRATGKYIKTNSYWKVFAKKTINGRHIIV